MKAKKISDIAGGNAPFTADGTENGVSDLQEAKYITVVSNRRKMVLRTGAILYVLVIGKNAEIHVSGGKIYGRGGAGCLRQGNTEARTWHSESGGI